MANYDIDGNLDAKSIGQSLSNIIAPIGTLCINISDPTSPATRFGGSWEQLPENVTLWSALSGGGTVLPAGIPNIKAVLSCDRAFFKEENHTYDGAFSTTNFSTSAYNLDWSGSKVGCSLNFDAKQGEIDKETGGYKKDSGKTRVYGESDTVQPPAIKVYMWKRVL